MTDNDTGPASAGHTVVYVDWAQFCIIDAPSSADAVWPVPTDWSNGLVSVEANGAVIHTGIRSGPANVAVEVHSREPTVGAGSWDEVVEWTMTSTRGWLRVLESVPSDQFTLPNLSQDGPGTYRVRCHARGRDITDDGSTLEPVEDYLIQAWPAPSESLRVVKQTDACGANMRLSVGLGPERTDRVPGVDREVVVPQQDETHASTSVRAERWTLPRVAPSVSGRHEQRVVRVAVREWLVEGGEEATATSREADEVGVCELAVTVDRGQLCFDVGDRVGPEFAPWMRSDAR